LHKKHKGKSMKLPPMSTKRRAIGVLRVSTDQQDCARQRKDVAAAARVHNLEIVRALELSDLSGTKMLTNTEVKRVLADLARHDIHGVIVSAIDRLIRPGQLGDLQIFDFFQRSKKLIWTPAQEIDITTQAGFLTSGIMGVIAGFERMMILARTSAGKEICRQRGGNPNGDAVLPRGIAYSKTSGWSYIEPDCSRIRRAYDLLFERRSWADIAQRIGGGFTGEGVSYSLRNTLWMGIRRYTEGREEPLEVKVIDPPLIPPDVWQKAQEIILEKRKRWTKTKRPAHVLLSGLLRCRCGKPCYVRMNGRTRSYYFCSTGYPGHGPACGARSVQQAAADQTVAHHLHPTAGCGLPADSPRQVPVGPARARPGHGEARPPARETRSRAPAPASDDAQRCLHGGRLCARIQAHRGGDARPRPAGTGTDTCRLRSGPTGSPHHPQLRPLRQAAVRGKAGSAAVGGTGDRAGGRGGDGHHAERYVSGQCEFGRTLKMVLVAPIPRARARTAVKVKPGLRPSVRTA
jgi:DNA invertase Pin-like site-specific DNA recombinase